jgi:hypothetical protein
LNSTRPIAVAFLVNRSRQLKWVLASALLWSASPLTLAHAGALYAEQAAASPIAATNALKGKWHSVEIRPSPQTPRICLCEKINPFWWLGNSDEPVPPDWFKPNEKGRALKWFWRNPFHNFTHYVIGIADKTYVRSGRYPDRVSNPNGGWNFAIARYRVLPLPYISYRRGKFEFYFGWGVRGNFGIKINYNAERTHPLPSGRTTNSG